MWYKTWDLLRNSSYSLLINKSYSLENERSDLWCLGCVFSKFYLVKEKCLLSKTWYSGKSIRPGFGFKPPLSHDFGPVTCFVSS